MITSRHIASRDEWLGWRRGYITASDVGVICGYGRYKTQAEVYAEKKGLVPATTMTESMKRGLWGEAAVCEALTTERPAWKIERAKVFLADDAAHLAATPDVLAFDPDRGPGIIQCKVVARPVFEDEWIAALTDFDTPYPPMDYMLQTLAEAMLWEPEAPHFDPRMAELGDQAWCAIAALVVDAYTWNLHIIDVPRHPEAEDRIRHEVADFWRNHIEANIAPPLNPQRDDELVKMLYPKDDGSTIDLTGDFDLPGLVDKLEDAKMLIKAHEKDKSAMETTIKNMIGTASAARIADGRIITWKLQQRAGYTVEPAEYRVLRIGKSK